MQHSFDVAVAQKVGVNAAILLQNILFWLEKNAANEKHLHDGRYWTYNSAKAFARQFPYMKESQIYATLNRMVDAGYLLKGNYNASAMDRTSWYSLTDDGIELMKNCASGIKIVAELPKPDPDPTHAPDADSTSSIASEGSVQHSVLSHATPLPHATVGNPPEAEFRKVVHCYETNIGMVPIGVSGEMLADFCRDLSADVVCMAIEATNRASPKSPWPYLRAILNQWSDAGITSVEKAAACLKDFERAVTSAKTSRAERASVKNRPKEPPAIEGDFY